MIRQRTGNFIQEWPTFRTNPLKRFFGPGIAGSFLTADDVVAASRPFKCESCGKVTNPAVGQETLKSRFADDLRLLNNICVVVLDVDSRHALRLASI
jgi:hypothetical protein